MRAQDSLVLNEVRNALEQAERKLKWFENMLHTIEAAIWSIDVLNGQFLYVSEAVTGITGYPPEQLVNLSNWSNIVHREDLPLYKAWAMKIGQGIPATSEYRIYHASGEVRWIQARIMPIVDECGQVIQLDGMMVDTTATKEMEAQLHRSEQKYKSLFHYNSDIICELDLEGGIRAINPAAEKITGERLYEADLNFPFEEVFGGDNLHKLTHHFNLAIQGHSRHYEVSSRHQNGKSFQWSMENVPIYVNNRIEGTFVIARDVTAHKQVEAAFADREAQCRRLVELSPVAIAIYKDGEITFLNPAGEKMLGVSFEGDSYRTNIMDWVHPHDREFALERMENTLLNGYSPPGEYKIIRADGRVIDISMISIYDSQSASIQLMFEDITVRKQAERALLEGEELNRRLIELSPEAIVLHKDYKFVYANLAGLALFGVSGLSELAGESIFDWIHPDFAEEVKQRLQHIYARHCVSSLVEQQIVQADGTLIDVEVIASTIPYKGDNAGITLFRDIRERKRADEDRQRTEQSIRESEDRHFRLQTSLDRFSHDLFGVMKVSHLERRLVKEVRDVLGTDHVKIMELDSSQIKLCELNETEDGYYLKIGEMKGRSKLLCIDEKPAALRITSIRVWLETIARYASVLLDNFLLIEDLTKELEGTVGQQIAPTWLLRLLFTLSENERKSLSQDLHDSALQEQIVWYRKLEHLRLSSALPEEVQEQLEQIAQGLLDVIYQIRITCNELRPPMLKEAGLVSSLHALFEFTQLRTNYSIRFHPAYIEHALNDDQLIGLYRIVQEMLANAAKHSSATEVHIGLSSSSCGVQLHYRDNGVGMKLEATEDSFNSMGIYGMKERVRSLNGTIEFRSPENGGMAIYIGIPIGD
ncbi:PAS domain S-box protein [Paenibacillus oenotherae]|uniref:histidine kinase n=1 Tax=Paenibacillus oenotherae TaxID=1435645 RepID=A0ABS7D363_9BACL|nr:PAS domain S-box protein [Paenibacillus oenotherae]MBW7474294.1 PAS domain S-box protein [Paenibacillus oenotherae]